MFYLPRAPKSSQNSGFYKCSQNTAICDTLATQHVRNAVFYSVIGAPSQKHWYLQCFVKTHARNTVNTNEFKEPQIPKTLLFTAFLRNFWLLKPPKTKRRGVPPPPFHILNFKILTTSKTWQFLELKTRPEPHFLTVFTMFYARASIFTQKMQHQKLSKSH